MTNTTPVSFDPKPRLLGQVDTYIAASAILAGQIVAYAASGDDRKVAPATSSLGSPVGVAAHDQATAGQPVTVYGDGCEVLIMLSTVEGTADAGDWIGVSTIAGCGITQDGAIASHTTEGAGLFPMGQAQVNISAGSGTDGGKGYIKINRSPIWTAVS